VITTTRVGVMVPNDALEMAREQFPEIHGMSAGNILRYALGVALGVTDPIKMTRDARVIDLRSDRRNQLPE
jgi:hypothetical protein